MIDITVAICTYNGQNRIPLVLKHLRSQVNTESIQWEILVVNNNSTDSTEAIVRQHQADWPDAYPLRYCVEPKQGLVFARQRAVQDGNGRLIAFLDDDNFPAPNWVAAAVEFSQSHPRAAAYGSQIHPLYEVEPPPNFDRIAIFLAIREVKKTFSYTNDPQHAPKRFFPPGAGLVVRKDVWLAHVPEAPVMIGRVNQSLIGGEDTEALTHIKQANWEIWHNPNMQIQHQIPQSRLTRDYLAKLLHDNGLGRHPLRMIGVPLWQRPAWTLAYLANDFRKLILYYIKHYRDLPEDTVAWSEMQVFVGSLKSPFFYWGR